MPFVIVYQRYPLDQYEGVVEDAILGLSTIIFVKTSIWEWQD